MTSSHRKPNSTPNNDLPPPSSPSSSNPRISGEPGSTAGDFRGAKPPHFPNPPDSSNPDPATLREQWRFAIRQYSKWYSHAWGTAILAGASFFALGWFIKGGNPLPSFKRDDPPPVDSPSSFNIADGICHSHDEEKPSVYIFQGQSLAIV
ncbi:hypothetical protein RJ640_030010 [Escallonia rubra]|uniref:Uncharacterized protein n=1 Tax=Escallonia rubra TaxID=112253 RepID=A0AA88QTM7_9ASTE|nr:hypothetical protein RJ640_030010 [Escallonia rubra]